MFYRWILFLQFMRGSVSNSLMRMDILFLFLMPVVSLGIWMFSQSKLVSSYSHSRFLLLAILPHLSFLGMLKVWMLQTLQVYLQLVAFAGIYVLINSAHRQKQSSIILESTVWSVRFIYRKKLIGCLVTIDYNVFTTCCMLNFSQKWKYLHKFGFVQLYC